MKDLIGFGNWPGLRYNTGMRRLPRSPLFVVVEYALALLLVGLTTGALHLFGSVLDAQIATVGYLVPVVVSTLAWGLGPGIVAALAAFFAFNYYFIEPRYTLLVAQPQDLLVLVVFLAIAVLLSQLLGRTRAALNAAQQREHEAMRLYEFSTALAGQQADHAIAHIVAQSTLETLQADRVEALVEAYGNQPVTSVCLPPDQPPTPDRPPTSVI